MEKKKVLFVVHHLTIGGVQKSLISALHAMNYDKYDITLYLQKNRTVLLPYIDKRVNVIINKDSRHYYLMPRSVILQLKAKAAKLAGNEAAFSKYNKMLADFLQRTMMKNEQSEYFKNKKFDVAVSYNAGVEAFFTSEYINADKKIVCFQASTIELPDMQPVILPKFDSVVVEDKSIEEMLLENIPALRGKINIIENYVDTDFLTEQATERVLEKPEGKAVFCSVGRQAYVKGFDIAVEAAKILKERNVSFLWYFVGDGPENSKIRELIEKYGLQNEIVLTGMQTNPYIYINTCDIFVQPSREEAMSIAALESQVLYKPLVTTKTVGGMNICKDGETGVMTEISAQGIADGIMKFIENPGLCRKISDNLKKTDYEAEKERYKKQWENILEAI